MDNPLVFGIFLIWVLIAAVSVIEVLLTRFGPKSIREWLKNHRGDKDV